MMTMPAWIRRLIKPQLTPTDIGARVHETSELEVHELAMDVFDRLTKCSDQQAEKDPQGLLFALAVEVEQERQPRPPATHAQLEATTAALSAAVGRLPLLQRETLLLHLDGLTYKQIATRCDITEKVAIQRLRRALGSLRTVSLEGL
jgi:RNA polymerase sigma factor (sigma-70 family)